MSCPECDVIDYGINPRCVACVRKVMLERISLLEAAIREGLDSYIGEGYLDTVKLYAVLQEQEE